MSPTAIPVSGPEHTSRPRDSELATRKPLALWDRVKFLLLLTGLYWFFVWAELADNPLLPFTDAVRDTVTDKPWIFWLAGIEVLRQLHYLVSEHWARYHQFWSKKIFGRFNARTEKINPWTRYRVARASKWLLALAVVAVVLATILKTSPFLAIFELPGKVLPYMPVFMQAIIFLSFWIGFQFFLILYLGSKGGIDTYHPDDIETRFTDVWGQDQVLDRVRENIVFLQNPEAIESRGGYVPGGILLWGPPGTGKTLMAEAVAGETGKPFVFVDPSGTQSMWTPPMFKIKLLFRKLRKYAMKYGGVVVFFDEADTLGNRGQLNPGPLGTTPSTGSRDLCNGLGYLSQPSAEYVMFQRLGSTENGPAPERRRFFFMGGGGGGGGGGALQALLTELSGLKKPRGFINRYVRRALGMRPKPPPKYRILVMMATNMPQALDEALLRPGRIDRIYKVGYPSKPGRIRTYDGYFEKVTHTLTEHDVDKLATITPYATGATIKDLVNESLITAIRDGRDVITWRDVIRAKQTKDLGPPEDVEYIERERHATALHEACHAVVAYRARHHLVIDIATIEKGGNYLGMVSSIPPEDLFTQWRSDYEADVMVSLASLAGEKMFFGGDSSSGVSSDLESATTLSILMEGYWGMGSTLASHGVTHRVGLGGGGRPGRPEEEKEHELLRDRLGDRIEVKLGELLERTERLLADNFVEVLAVTHALESHKTLTGDDIKAVVDGTPGPLVDGTAYHSPEFAEQAKQYHDCVVVAHKEHSTVDVPLPTLNGQRGPDFIAIQLPQGAPGDGQSKDDDA
jgi:cell division protease FtsH